MKKVLVIGSINMDYTIYVNRCPKEGETLSGKSRFIQPGGKGANQAAALAKSGANVSFIGAVGNDADSKVIKETFKEIGLDISNLKISEKETGNATIIVDDSSENRIVIVPGANGDLRPEDISLDLIKNSDFILLQNEISEETNEFVMKEAHKAGKIVVYNPAPYRPINSSLFQFVDYFIPNKIELASYSGKESLEEGCNQMLSLGVKNLIVTLGVDGSLFVNKEKKFHVDAYKVKAVDTVAAGDTFVGYFLAGLANGLSEEDSMRQGSKASSITVSRKGSIVSIPFAKEL